MTHTAPRDSQSQTHIHTCADIAAAKMTYGGTMQSSLARRHTSISSARYDADGAPKSGKSRATITQAE